MKKCLSMLAAATVALSLMSARVAFADDEPSRPIPEDKQEELLKEHGDEGIDANDDGTLTRDEVRAFFAEKRKHGKRGRGGRDGRGPGGPRDPVAGLLRTIEMFSADTPPDQFDAGRIPSADVDGDGELSDSEWATFAAQRRERLLTRLARLAPDADTDEDGEISDKELAALKAKVRGGIVKKHPDADKDGDGTLSDAEFDAFMSRDAQERRARILEQNPEADLDGDGTLSEEETRAFVKSRRGRVGDKRTLRRGGVKRDRGKSDE